MRERKKSADASFSFRLGKQANKQAQAVVELHQLASCHWHPIGKGPAASDALLA